MPCQPGRLSTQGELQRMYVQHLRVAGGRVPLRVQIRSARRLHRCVPEHRFRVRSDGHIWLVLRVKSERDATM